MAKGNQKKGPSKKQKKIDSNKIKNSSSKSSLFDILHEKKLINKYQYLWWEVVHPGESRTILSLKDFSKGLTKVGVRFDKSKTRILDDHYLWMGDGKDNSIPVILPEVELYGEKVKLMATIRPFTVREFKQYFDDANRLKYSISEGPGFNLFQDFGEFIQSSENLMTPGLNLIMYLPEYRHLRDKQKPSHKTISKRIFSKLKSKLEDYDGEWRWPLMFKPHVRGIVKSADKTKIIYYPLLSSLLENGGDSEILSFKEDLLYQVKWETRDLVSALLYHRNSPSDKVKRVIDRLMEENLVSYTGRNPGLRRSNASPKILKFHWRGLELVPYDEFRPGKTPLVTYYPITMSPLEEAVAVAISNRLEESTNVRKTYVLGIFNAFFPERKLKTINEGYRKIPSELQIIPFKNESYARKISEKVTKYLNIEVEPTIYKVVKGSSKIKTI